MSQTDKLLLDFATALRASKTGVEARSAVLEGERLDIIRGKDFVRWVRSNVDSIELPMAKAKSPEDAARDLGSLLLRRQFMVRCDRKFKKPPPGQDRLIKFPKKVAAVTGADANTFSEADFYAWRFEAPTSPWVYAVSALAAVGVVLVCLFPVAPPIVKMCVVYGMMSILIVMIGLLVLRAVVATASWIATGRTVWILPNALADDKPVSELFSPLIAVQEPELKDDSTGAWVKHLAARLGTGAVLAGIVYVLYAHSPGTDKVKQSAFRYRDELFEMLNVHGDTKLIKGNATAEAAAAAARDAANDTAGAAGGDEGSANAAGAEASETKSEL